MSSVLNILLLVAGIFLVSPAFAATLKDWRSRTIYQVLTDRFARSDGSKSNCNELNGHYCHGTWRGIEQNLDYIQGMNFDAIWISPIVAQLPQSTGDGQAYTGYWAQDLYALNEEFGTVEDLKSLIEAVHSRDMYIMLDVVVNHMGYAGAGDDVQYDVFKPFDDEKYFHSYCAVDASSDNQTNVEVCWLGSNIVALADLRTEDEEVREMLGDWISGIVSNNSFDGLRIDTALNVEPDFFSGFVEAAGVFATGEAMAGDASYVCEWEDGIGSMLNYPIYFPLIRAFSSAHGNIDDLTSTIYDQYENCDDPTTFGIFSENHDVERFPSITNDTALVKNVLAFTILFDGIPIIYQGQEQHTPGGVNPYMNRAPLWESGFNTSSLLYEHIATLVRARQHFIAMSEEYTTQTTDIIYQDYHSFAMRKGVNDKQVITILNNNGAATETFKIRIKGHGFESGTEITEILTCTNITVDHKGRLNVPMGVGLPKVLYPAELLAGSGLCGMSKATPTTVTTAYSTTINGQATQISTTLTGTSITTATPSETKKSAGPATVYYRDATVPLAITLFTMVMFSLGGTYTLWH